MIMTEETRHEVSVCERRVLAVLHEKGPQTLDALCELPEFNWAQVLMAVDHLTRSRQVLLELIRPREYRVSLTGTHE
jgi:hypothetical protein